MAGVLQRRSGSLMATRTGPSLTSSSSLAITLHVPSFPRCPTAAYQQRLRHCLDQEEDRLLARTAEGAERMDLAAEAIGVVATGGEEEEAAGSTIEE